MERTQAIRALEQALASLASIMDQLAEIDPARASSAELYLFQARRELQARTLELTEA